MFYATKPSNSYFSKLLGAAFFITAIASMYWPAACVPTCASPERQFSGGHRDLTAKVYETSGPEGPFLPFDGGAVYRIQHGLGIKPSLTLSYLSFSEYPENPGGGGSTQAAGNQVIVLKQDEQEIVLKNDTCSSLYLRLVAFTQNFDLSSPSDASLSD